jgi:hypothetical protein
VSEFEGVESKDLRKRSERLSIMQGWIRMAGLAFSVHKFTCDDLPVCVAFALSKDHHLFC